MDYLMRDDAPFSEEQWQQIDNMVNKTASQLLIGRRFIPLYGPLGAGVQSINLDEMQVEGQAEKDFFGDLDTEPVRPASRKFVEIPLLYKDFAISWRDVEHGRKMNLPIDLAATAAAAAVCARKEDELIFLGDSKAGVEGLLTAKGSVRMKKKDWQKGEAPFLDVAAAVEALTNKGFVGNMALTVSPDLYLQMQRIQPNMGLMELDRVKSLVDGHLYQSPVLGKEKAVLVCAQPQNLDLVVGQDMVTGYLGPDKLNHVMRVLETLLLRIKHKDAVVVLE